MYAGYMSSVNLLQRRIKGDISYAVGVFYLGDFQLDFIENHIPAMLFLQRCLLATRSNFSAEISNRGHQKFMEKLCLKFVPR